MSCNEILHHLDAWADGSLAAETAETVRNHLESCGACRDEADRLSRLVRDLGALPREVEPRRDLWPEIESRLEPRVATRTAPRTSSMRRGLIAASLAAALLATGYFTRDLIERRGRVLAPVASSPSGDALPANLSAEPLDSERAFLLVRRQIRDELERRRDTLSPETLRAVELNVKVIDRSIERIRLALVEDPGNPELNRLLASTPQKARILAVTSVSCSTTTCPSS